QPPGYGLVPVRGSFVRRGSYLACSNEELWNLDPLKIMEESLKVEAALAKAPKASSGKQVKARRGLWGLAKAFEVLEQAALNLYLGPWREEYKVVKMYSGMFTHYIKPVLSLAQIEKLFGLLGYQRSTRREQLHLQLHTVSPLILDDLLCLSCAFYLARCECQLLLTALEAHGGDPRWELCMNDSLSWGPLPVKLYHNGSLSSSSQAMKEYVSVSTLSCQVTSKSESEPFRGSSARVSQPSNAGGKITADSPPYGRQEDGVGMGKNEDESNHLCSSLQSPNLYLNQCIECNSAHNISSAVLQHYSQGGNSVLLPDDMKESAALSPPRQNVRPQALNLSLTLSSSAAAMSSLALCDNPKPLIPIYHPISYHDCCDLSHLDS
uniref:Spermatogenesis associated 2 like n=1 Tax=Hippocampus comes TaxID=109280 RepID=A0A3Q2XMP0_HIPCM